MYFSSAIIKDLIEYAALCGHNSATLNKKYAPLLKQQHIDYKTITMGFNDFRNLLKDEHLGLHIGEQISLKVTAYVSSIMQYSNTLEEAFENGVKYSKQISDALSSSLQKKEHSYSLIFEENPNWKVQQTYIKKQILDLTLLCTLKSITTYTNKKYFPIQVCFGYPKPRSLNEYYRLFNCRLKFNQPENQIVFEKQIFKKYSKNVKQGLLESLVEKVNLEIAHLTPENELILRLKKMILQRKPERLTLEEAADALFLSKRTLNRKLKNLETSFKKIEQELLLNLSMTYLEENQKTIEEISYLLGFSESSAFIRFFKSHMNQVPSAYRKSHV